jgi:hypothetical protein
LKRFPGAFFGGGHPSAFGQVLQSELVRAAEDGVADSYTPAIRLIHPAFWRAILFSRRQMLFLVKVICG